ncbi:MAG: dTDP-4-dehydrorhamnose 3,5-epimerase [Bacteroidota bacterium]
MKIEETNIQDLVLITVDIYRDDRGYFKESYNQKRFEKVTKTKFVQDNESLSKKGVLRGLHFQRPPFAQAKLVRVIKGSILDVAVDLRKNSPTFGEYFSHIISDENKKQLFIPIGFAHGFLSLEDDTIVNYKCSEFYNKESEDSIVWNDETLKIDWGIDTPIIAEKDKNAQKFSNFKNPFNF